VKVLWTEAALSQLHAIYDYIAHTSPDYASRMIDRLTRRSIQISGFPFSGRIVPEYQLNEIREVREWPYRIIYLIQLDHSQIEVLAVVHGARSHPRLSKEESKIE